MTIVHYESLLFKSLNSNQQQQHTKE